MKQIRLVFFIMISIIGISGFSQELTYGLQFGPTYSFLEEDKGRFSSPNGNEKGFHLSSYLNYPLSNRFGIVGNISYQKLNYSYSVLYENRILFKETYLGISPMFKFDVSGDYNKGFYIKPGFFFIMPLKTDVSIEYDREEIPANFEDQNSNMGVSLSLV